MRTAIIRFLLAALNSRWLNQSPCQYGFIGNVDAFSLGNLKSEERQRPGITVKTILQEAERFRSCPLTARLIIFQDGDTRDPTTLDFDELRQSLKHQKEAAKG
jgi:hypothetical protein